jgi:hypothetical protein
VSQGAKVKVDSRATKDSLDLQEHLASLGLKVDQEALVFLVNLARKETQDFKDHQD